MEGCEKDTHEGEKDTHEGDADKCEKPSDRYSVVRRLAELTPPMCHGEPGLGSRDDGSRADGRPMKVIFEEFLAGVNESGRSIEETEK